MLLAACSSQSPASATTVVLDRDFDLKTGETARLEESDLVVRFEAVTSDSRCPVDVTCVWEGDATIRVSLARPPREKESHELHTAGPRRAAYGELEVQVSDLRPQPRSTAAVPPGDYRLSLVVRRVP